MLKLVYVKIFFLLFKDAFKYIVFQNNLFSRKLNSTKGMTFFNFLIVRHSQQVAESWISGWRDPLISTDKP